MSGIKLIVHIDKKVFDEAHIYLRKSLQLSAIQRFFAKFLFHNYLNFSNLEFLSNKRKKDVLQNMELIKMNYTGNFDEDLKKVKEIYNLEKELIDNNNYVNQLKNFVKETTLIILQLLTSTDFVYI